MTRRVREMTSSIAACLSLQRCLHPVLVRSWGHGVGGGEGALSLMVLMVVLPH
jgi:hypothetical protein